MLIVFMAGSGMLFLSISAFSIFYVFNNNFTLSAYPFPKSFVLSTIVLLFSGAFFYKARENFEHSFLKPLLINLSIVLIGSLIFIGFQLNGWFLVIEYVNDIGSKNLTSFVLALSGIHALHLIGGLVFLVMLMVSVYKSMKDGVKSLLFSTEPYTKVRIATLSLYWVYIEIIWVLQFLLFYLVYWVH